MAYAAYLFDLDGTLIDTSALAAARQARRWKECVSRLGETTLYPGMMAMLTTIRERGAKIGIVTTSVSYYAESALRHHRIIYDTLVAYHDVRRPKPAPDGYLRALHSLGASAADAIGIGDDAVDALALEAASIRSVRAGWNQAFHAGAVWSVVARTPDEIVML